MERGACRAGVIVSGLSLGLKCRVAQSASGVGCGVVVQQASYYTDMTQKEN